MFIIQLSEASKTHSLLLTNIKTYKIQSFNF